MRPIKLTVAIIFLATAFTACNGAPETIPPKNTTPETVTPEALKPAKLLISEVMTGVEGNNRYDFIELYNAGDSPADLKEFSLWYQLKDDDEEILLYRWNQTVLVPPLGHYLLGQAGQDFGLPLDAKFNQSLVASRGGLILRYTGELVADMVTWGNGPRNTQGGSSAPEMSGGTSLERKPGGDQGNMTDSDDNGADFILNPDPIPQNTGSPITPTPEGVISYTVDYPEIVMPGCEFEYVLHIENSTGMMLENLSATFTIPAELAVVDVGVDVSLAVNVATWLISSLEDGEVVSTSIGVVAPWTFTSVVVHSSYAQAENWKYPDFANPLYTVIGGGAIPIATARTLIGQAVVIEGIATMYTGGFYAGSGAKFYVEDETAGLQIYVAGAGGQLNIPIGAKVRIQGRIELYRGALELIPPSIDKVEILGSADDQWPPAQISLNQAANDMETLPGRLVQVEGVIARVEEFSYSYEVDIVDSEGQLVTCYVDKDTGITVEAIESGQHYRITGIIEIRDGRQQLNPRLQSDFEKVYPPVLLIEAESPATVEPGDQFTISFTAYNHTSDPMTNVVITATLPSTGVEVVTVNDDGEATDNTVVWSLPELAGEGGHVTVSLDVRATGSGAHISIDTYSATADQWNAPAIGIATNTFYGTIVPVWAIQGNGSRSPYVLQEVQTQGIVTGIFPDLGGFWIQELYSDDNPQTSAAIFINTGLARIEVTTGDLVTVTGRVRESFQQTQLVTTSPKHIEILSQNGLLPAPVELDPPLDNTESEIYFESLEGMLVQISGPAVVVGPSNQYGEFAVVLSSHGVERAWQGTENGFIIRVDDGLSITHEDQSTMEYAVATGDRISNLVGPLAFTYGNFKIEPTTAFAVMSQPVDLPTLPPMGEGEFSMMTWNVENLFDFLAPHPSSPSMPTVGEYKTSLAKIANTILAVGAPTIIGLQEVENIGVLEDIAGHALLLVYDYQPVLIEGTDSRGIDVGYLVRGDQATVVKQIQYPAPEGITSRPPLLVKVELLNSDSPSTVYVLNNHFTSMSGGEQATEPRRNAQAAWNVSIFEDILAQNPDAYLAVMGDLNSYYDSLPIDTLRNAGLCHVFELLDETERYTYIYQGISQVLDHILVTPSLMELVSEVHILHVNADYPLPLPDDETPLHKSDHDPVIVIFALP